MLLIERLKRANKNWVVVRQIVNIVLHPNIMYSRIKQYTMINQYQWSDGLLNCFIAKLYV